MFTTTTAVERYRPALTEPEQVTLRGFLAAYRGYTRDAYALDLRSYRWSAGETSGGPRLFVVVSSHGVRRRARRWVWECLPFGP